MYATSPLLCDSQLWRKLIRLSFHGPLAMSKENQNVENGQKERPRKGLVPISATIEGMCNEALNINNDRSRRNGRGCTKESVLIEQFECRRPHVQSG